MVCIYCGNDTRVTNSRPQKRRNSVWRRRECLHCNAIFTSIEQVDCETSLAFENATSHIAPFSRDQLFISIYEACRHREHAVLDASNLTDTILNTVLKQAVKNGVVTRTNLARIALETLQRFDEAAAMYYKAYHRT